MDKKLRIGIIGFGIFGEKRLIPGFEKSHHAQLIAISKRDIRAAEIKAKRYNIPFAYGSVENLLKNDEVEAVFIASPNKFHLQHVKNAAIRGKHILLEKPMALNAEECKKMIEI